MFREILIALRRIVALIAVLWFLLILIYFPYHTDEPPSAAALAALRTYYNSEKTTDPSPFEVPFAQLHNDVTSLVREFAQNYGVQHKRVLEIGAGTGYLQDVVDDYTGLDIGAVFRRYYHKPFVVGSATALPFSNSGFDGAWSIYVYEHVINPELGFSELRRVVRDGGVVMLLPAWNCTSWAAEGYDVRPYRDLTMKGKIIKASLGIRAQPLFQAVYRYPIRLLRLTSAMVWREPTRLHFSTLRPNYSHYWGPDADAVNSIDRFEALQWFLSRGDQCLNCGNRDFWRSEGPLVLRIHKET